MEITIEKAVLHILDTHVDAPVLSDTLLASEEALTYLGGLAAKAWKSDEAKACSFADDSAVAPMLATLDEDFVGKTGQIADRWFSVLMENPAIPAGDVAFLLLNIDGKDYFAALKLNYKAGWAHFFEMHPSGTSANDIVRQETLLPSSGTKPDEAFFAEIRYRADGGSPAVRVLEKKYDMDGRRQSYLARRVVGAKPGLSPKEKLEVIREAAVEVNQQFYGNLGVEEPEVAAAVCAEYRAQRSAASQSLASPEETVPVAQLCDKLYGDLPHAREAFEKVLAEHEIAMEEPLPMPAASVRKMEKQSIRSAGGVEIKVPVSVYRDENTLEFIRNEDGTTSLLIKNILL